MISNIIQHTNQYSCAYSFRELRRWVPELVKVPQPYLAAPWKMDLSVQRVAQCMIGADYPAPIVEDKAAMKAAKDRMYGLPKTPRSPNLPSPQGDLFA